MQCKNVIGIVTLPGGGVNDAISLPDAAIVLAGTTILRRTI